MWVCCGFVCGWDHKYLEYESIFPISGTQNRHCWSIASIPLTLPFNFLTQNLDYKFVITTLWNKTYLYLPNRLIAIILYTRGKEIYKWMMQLFWNYWIPRLMIRELANVTDIKAHHYLIKELNFAWGPGGSFRMNA